MSFSHCINSLADCYRSLVARAWLMSGVAALAACGGGDNAPSVQSALFSNLGFLSGYASSRASAISADGSVVAGAVTTASGNSQAFRWSAKQGMTGLGFLPGGSHSGANGVSADGSVVVGTGDSSSAPVTPSSGFRWIADRGIIRIDPVPGSYLCAVSGVSGDGATATGTCLTSNSEAFRWTESAGSTGLGRFGGGSDQTSSATAISGNASVIVGAGHPSLTGAVLWRVSGTATILGKLPGDESASALAVSRDGTVVVGASVDGVHISRAFRWTQDTGMIALESMIGGMAESVASGVSGEGTIVVGWARTATGESAVIWDTQHGLRSLETALSSDYNTEIAGWKLTRATAISDDGRTIAGYGTNPQGQTEAWIVKLPD